MFSGKKFILSTRLRLMEPTAISQWPLKRCHAIAALAAILLSLSLGCRQSSDANLLSEKERLERENQELRRQLESTREESQRLQTSMEGLKGGRNQLDAPKAESEPSPRTGLQSPIIFSDSANSVEVQVTDILLGNEAVSAGKYHRFQLENLQQQGKTIIYLGIRITNKSYSDEMRIAHSNFKLTDNKNNTYACEQTRDYVRGSIHLGHSTSGGIAFAVDADAIPSELIYNTGFVLANSRSKVYATLKNLRNLEAFKDTSSPID